MVTLVVQVALTRPSREPSSWPYNGFPIDRVLCQPPLDISTTPNLLPSGSVPGLEESIPFDSSGDPIPLIFLLLLLIFFNQHSRHGFYPLSRLSLDIFLSHTNLWVVRPDHPVVKIIGNDHVLDHLLLDGAVVLPG
jgi:hypothetical protein